jgi:hypothetical protein
VEVSPVLRVENPSINVISADICTATTVVIVIAANAVLVVKAIIKKR